jgi:hypothetical protein
MHSVMTVAYPENRGQKRGLNTRIFMFSKIRSAINTPKRPLLLLKPK